MLDNSWNKCSDLDGCLAVQDITVDSEKSLVALTEAPTYNMLKWCSPIYEENGSIKTMISTGHHTNDEWMSVLFQFVYTCAVLQEHKILFNKMSIENN